MNIPTIQALIQDPIDHEISYDFVLGWRITNLTNQNISLAISETKAHWLIKYIQRAAKYPTKINLP